MSNNTSTGSFDIQGNPISEHEWTAKHESWLPSQEELEFVKSLMHPVTEQGKIAGWIAPPNVGVNKQSFSFEYVKNPSA